MIQRVILGVLTCIPLVLVLAAWIRLCRTQRWPKPLALAALGMATATALYSAGMFFHYTFFPWPSLPPWKDPEILNFGLLFLFAPVGMILGAATAGRRAGPAWLILIVEIASVPLSLVGIMAGAAV